MLKYLFLVTLLYPCTFAIANSFKQRPVVLGDNVITILKKNGFTEAQRQTILKINPDLRELFLTLDTKYLVSAQKNSAEVRLYDSQSTTAFRVWRNGPDFGAEPIHNLSTTLMDVSGVVRGSIMANILDKVESNWIASRFIDAYIFDIKPQEIDRGARFSFTVEKKFDQGFFVKYGEILKTSLEIDGKAIQKNFVRSNTGGVFITEEDLLSPKPFYAPVDYIRVASLFQPNRRHPITRRVQPHLGVDFELPAGEKVYAAKKGIVARMGNSRAAGNYVVLLHANGVETSYNHLGKVMRNLRIGTAVTGGEPIGIVGCSGYCTRAHLHFAIRYSKKMVDPLKYTKPFPSGMRELLERRVARN